MKKDKSKKKSLVEYFGSSYVNLIIFISLVLVGVAALVIGLLTNSPYKVFYVVAGIIFAFAGVALVTLVVVMRKYYKSLNKDIMPVIHGNLEKISKNKKNFELIKNDEYAEYKDLNEIFINLKSKYDSQTFVAPEADFREISLEYQNESKGIVTYDSLIKNAEPLILASASYMNAFVNIHYDVSDKIANRYLKKHMDYILKRLEYDNRLVALNPDKKGFTAYIPCFDSISQLKEELEDIVSNTSVLIKAPDGKKYQLAKLAMVVYPYSDIDSIISDLEKASESKKVVNIYLPSGFAKKNEDMLHPTRNLNKVSYLIEQAAALDPKPEKREQSYAKLTKLIDQFADYYAFEGAGFVKFDDIHRVYKCSYSYGEKFFEPGEIVEEGLVNALEECKDFNGSYYFTSKKHLNASVRSYLDLYFVSSGSIYVIHRYGRPHGLLYFMNKSKDIYYDSYLKQCLMVFSSLIGKYVSEGSAWTDSNLKRRKYSEILRFSSALMYSVDKEDYTLTYASDAFRKEKKVTYGKKCYEVLFGLDSPCEKCPLKTNKHMLAKFGKKNVDIGSIFKNQDDQEAHLNVSIVAKGDEAHDRFDKEYLIPSFKSFKESIENNFLLEESGMNLSLIVSNSGALVDKLGNDGFIDLCRDYFRRLERKGLEVNLFKSNAVSAVVPKASDEDITKLVEELHLVAKELGLSVCYIAKEFPGKAKEANEYLKELNSLVGSYKTEGKDNTIYFVDSNYLRPADHDEFIISSILDSIKDNTLSVGYLPFLSNHDRLIRGGEMLLRLKDAQSGQLIDTSEALNVVKNTNHISDLTDGYVGVLKGVFEKYGYGFFLSMGVEHISIHTDHSYFDRDDLLDRVKAITESNSLEKGFIIFEVSEKDFASNLAAFKEYSHKLHQVGASLGVNQYKGDLAPISALSDAGVDMVKISNELSSGVNGSQAVLDSVLSMWREIAKNKMQVSFESIVNREQADLIHIDEVDCYVSGNYYFEVSEIDSFVANIKARNRKDDEFNS